MHRPQLITWTTHTAETTTLLEATRLQKLNTYMCNIVTELVTEFYLYSIVYIYLINSRLDVTHSVRHHFRTIQTLSSCTTLSKVWTFSSSPSLSVADLEICQGGPHDLGNLRPSMTAIFF